MIDYLIKILKNNLSWRIWMIVNTNHFQSRAYLLPKAVSYQVPECVVFILHVDFSAFVHLWYSLNSANQSWKVKQVSCESHQKWFSVSGPVRHLLASNNEWPKLSELIHLNIYEQVKQNCPILTSCFEAFLMILSLKKNLCKVIALYCGRIRL